VSCLVLVTAQAKRTKLPLYEVYDAQIIQTYESNNAVLPFMTVPLIDRVRNGLMTRTVKHREKAWHWTYEGLSRVPTIGNARAYSTRWVLRETAEGDPLAWVRFQMRTRDDSSSRRRRPCGKGASERPWRSVSFAIATLLLMIEFRSKPGQRPGLCSPSRAVPEYTAAGVSTGSSRAVIDAAAPSQRSRE
jgi:ribosomal protein S17E